MAADTHSQEDREPLGTQGSPSAQTQRAGWLAGLVPGTREATCRAAAEGGGVLTSACRRAKRPGSKNANA